MTTPLKLLNSMQIGLFEEKKQKKLLMLDIDETLIHTQLLRDKADLIIGEKCCENSLREEWGVRFRPYLKIFLRIVQRDFDIGIFTASPKHVI